MTRTKKIIIGILIAAVIWIGFRTAVVAYSLYQDGWRLGENWQGEIADALRYYIFNHD